MGKEAGYRILISLVFFLLGVFLEILPGKASEVVAYLCPGLLAASFSGILCNGFFGLLCGVLAPLLGFLISGEGTLVPDTVLKMICYGITGFTAGIFYEWKKRPVYTALLLVTESRFLWGLIYFVYYLAQGHFYSLTEFFQDAFLSEYPGLILALIGIPGSLYFLGKTGVLGLIDRDYK